MRAAVRKKYCTPDDLELQEIEKPDVTDDGVLVRVRAASVNRADWYGMTGTPYFARTMTGVHAEERTLRNRLRRDGRSGRQGRQGLSTR